ncbi:MAG: hypothetical protein ACE5JX_15050 [Acidobacteriota bacterium]
MKLKTYVLLGSMILGWPLVLSRAARAQSPPLINEFVANHSGSDTHEFVEILGDPDTDLSAFSVLQVEGDSGFGTIDAVYAVGTTDGAGFVLIGFLEAGIENGTMTLLLVENFSGAPGDDLDTDDDGVMDFMPFDRIVDDVAVSDGGATDLTYSKVALGPGFDGSPDVPGGASRIPNGSDSDSVEDWVRNDPDGEGLPGFVGTPEAGEALNTPGTVNRSVEVPIVGTATGFSSAWALCVNRTTGQSIPITLEGLTSWNCTESGLSVTPGDTVVMAVVGSAN